MLGLDTVGSLTSGRKGPEHGTEARKSLPSPATPVVLPGPPKQRFVAPVGHVFLGRWFGELAFPRSRLHQRCVGNILFLAAT